MPVLRLRREGGSIRPGWAILVFALISGAGIGFEALLVTLLLGRLRFGDAGAAFALSLRALWAVFATWVACRMVRWPMGDAHLRDERWRARVLQGVGLGTVMLAVVTLIPVGFGHERFQASAAPAREIAATFLWGGLACVWISVSEELWVRGFVLRQLSRSRGKWLAAAVTGLAFGLMHARNPGATWLALFNVGLVGVWLAFTVFWTGSLWMAMGFHFTWDLLESAFWGEPLSGAGVRASVLVRLPPGSELWTGGAFGPEASVPATVLFSVLILLFAPWPKRQSAIRAGGAMTSQTATSTTGTFELFNDYERTVYALQPELYQEIRAITEAELRAARQALGRAPAVLDVGSAGLIPYDPSLASSVTILDLFPRPAGMELKPGVTWQVGDILKHRPEDDGSHDVILMSSVLHHLADRNNHATANVRLALANVARRLRPGGMVLVFESVCPPVLALAQDLLYPVTSRLLVGPLHFTYVRMLSRGEVQQGLDATGLPHGEVAFRQPKHIAQMRWRVPSRFYPLTVRCFKATKPAA